MCGRFASVTPPEALRGLFRTTNTVPNFPARWNLAPTQDMLVVRVNPETRERSLDVVRWGLIPHWAKDASIGPKLINARSDGLAEKPSFKGAFQRRRCLIPADAFYEWKLGTKPKEPYAIRPADGDVFAFAGLWENWRNQDGVWVRTATIITTEGNEPLAQLHNRMPVILPPNDWPTWLGEEEGSPEAAMALLTPAPSDAVTIYPVSRAVSDVRNEGAELLAPVGQPPSGLL